MNKTENEECVVTGNELTKSENPHSIDTTPHVGVYGFRNKETNKWYVGQSLNIPDRWSRYRKLRCKSQRKWYNALVKYGYDGFEATILEQCDASQLDEREAFWVKEKDSVKNGYNIREGGSSRKHSEETKQLIRAKRALQVIPPRSEEAKEAMRQWNAQYWATHEHPLKGKKNATRTYTDEQLNKMQEGFRTWLENGGREKMREASAKRMAEHGNPMKGKKRPDLAERNRQRSNHSQHQQPTGSPIV
ncbi:MAG: GIY-YIG nuclease family protein [Candidatus Paceibacterota bacterium]